MDKKDAYSYLTERAIKPSIHRISVMQYLLDNATHPTVDTIYESLHNKIPTLSKTTVYNTLKLLSEKQAILSLSIDEKMVHYDGNTTPHAHFRCLKCEKIYDIPMIDNLAMSLLSEQISEFEVIDTQINITGYCSKCNTKKK